MAIHRRRYRPLDAGLTPASSRFLVLPRYAWSGSKVITGYLGLCLVPALVGAVFIYLASSTAAQALLGVNGMTMIDGRFFYWLLHFQGSLALGLAAWMGPGLVAPDLANGALPLYLCRPFSRAEYVLGRVATLAFFLSVVTWVPDLLLFGLQASLAEPGWTRSHLGLAAGIVGAGWIWIALLALLVLAISAWVRWRLVATGLFGGLFFLSHSTAFAANEALRTSWGSLLSLYTVVTTLWQALLGFSVIERHRHLRTFDPRFQGVPVGACVLVLLAVAAICLLLLNRRLRGREVTRG
jgi:ABC-2 type transport system permease protein